MHTHSKTSNHKSSILLSFSPGPSPSATTVPSFPLGPTRRNATPHSILSWGWLPIRRHKDGSAGSPGVGGGEPGISNKKRKSLTPQSTMPRPCGKGGHKSGIYSGPGRGSPVAQQNVQIPPPTCCMTLGHRLSSEKGQQWHLSHQLDMSSAQSRAYSEAKTTVLFVVTSVLLTIGGQDWLCENSVREPQL